MTDRAHKKSAEWYKKDPYEGNLPARVKVIKTYLQFFIGASLVLILTLKGFLEVIETLQLLPFIIDNDITSKALVAQLLKIKTFSYIANALAISAGIELSYMLFTDGPDEAIEPLMLGITSAAFYTLSANSGGSWVLGIYAISILILMYCLKKYKDWGLDHTNSSTNNKATNYFVEVKEDKEGNYSVQVDNSDN